MQSTIRIVVADRGFVYVGNVSKTESGLMITNARNIRKWGTSRGLGQLAVDGPQQGTVLDNVGTVEIPTHAVMHIIECDGEKWNK